MCVPVQAFWITSLAGKCLDIKTVWPANAIPNIITDVVLLALPVHFSWSLQIPRSQKAALMGIFLLGGLYAFPRFQSTLGNPQN